MKPAASADSDGVFFFAATRRKENIGLTPWANMKRLFEGGMDDVGGHVVEEFAD